MPHHKSAKKQIRQDAKRRLRNRSTKHLLRTRSKKVHALATEGKHEESADALKEASSAIDKAAGKRIIHPNKAARLKSSLAKRASQAKA